MNSARKLIAVFAAVLVAAVFIFAGWAFSSQDDPGPVESGSFVVEVPFSVFRGDMARVIGDAFGWSEKEMGVFASTHAQMQWAEFSQDALEAFTKRFEWGDAEREIFLTRATYYLDPLYDFFSSVYEPGIYEIPEEYSHARIAGLLIARTRTAGGEDIQAHIASQFRETAVHAVAEMVGREIESLPDLVALPAQDVHLREENGRTLLVFSTTYYNQGRGPLELRVDPKTAGVEGDVERDVFQRVYRMDGEYRDNLVGTFLWHEPHLHYHFEDFASYVLEAVEVEDEEGLDLSGAMSKSTFCIRDVSRVSLELRDAVEEATYQICDREMQGVSVGWGDTYFYNYIGQNLDITGIPSGTYALVTVVNPEHLFDEVTEENNTSRVVMDIDVANLSVEVLEEAPEGLPEVEHVYPIQENCKNCTL